MVPEIGSVMSKIFWHSRPFFVLLPLLQPEKLRLKRLEISSSYTCVAKLMIRWCMDPKIQCATDRGMNKKWYIEVGASPKKICDRSWDIRLNNYGPD